MYSTAHGSFSKIDHILGHKTDLGTFRKNRITHCILSKHSKHNILTAKKYPKIYKFMKIKQLITEWWVELRKIKQEINNNNIKNSPKNKENETA